MSGSPLPKYVEDLKENEQPVNDTAKWEELNTDFEQFSHGRGKIKEILMYPEPNPPAPPTGKKVKLGFDEMFDGEWKPFED